MCFPRVPWALCILVYSPLLKLSQLFCSRCANSSRMPHRESHPSRLTPFFIDPNSNTSSSDKSSPAQLFWGNPSILFTEPWPRAHHRLLTLTLMSVYLVFFLWAISIHALFICLSSKCLLFLINNLNLIFFILYLLLLWVNWLIISLNLGFLIQKRRKLIMYLTKSQGSNEITHVKNAINLIFYCCYYHCHIIIL